MGGGGADGHIGGGFDMSPRSINAMADPNAGLLSRDGTGGILGGSIFYWGGVVKE
jgi:hypothetical protein